MLVTVLSVCAVPVELLCKADLCGICVWGLERVFVLGHWDFLIQQGLLCVYDKLIMPMLVGRHVLEV